MPSRLPRSPTPPRCGVGYNGAPFEVARARRAAVAVVSSEKQHGAATGGVEERREARGESAVAKSLLTGVRSDHRVLAQNAHAARGAGPRSGAGGAREVAPGGCSGCRPTQARAGWQKEGRTVSPSRILAEGRRRLTQVPSIPLWVRVAGYRPGGGAVPPFPRRGQESYSPACSVRRGVRRARTCPLSVTQQRSPTIAQPGRKRGEGVGG